jgi:outer membrane protein insertion porin family
MISIDTNMKKIIYLITFNLFFIFSSSVQAQNTSKVTGITVEGIVHASAHVVTDVISIKKNQLLTDTAIAESISSIYQTGLFDNVQINQKKGVVTIVLHEKPYMTHVEITGIKLVPEDKLSQLQKDLHILKGSFYDESNINSLKVSLKQLYDSMGYYNARVYIEKTTTGTSALSIEIKVHEGSQARIRQISIIGNHAFKKSELLKLLTLNPTNFWSLLTSNDKYAKQKLDADLETLRSYYMNRGYVKFTIGSVAVSITPDKKHIYITLYVNEGGQYTIDSVDADSLVSADASKTTEAATVAGDLRQLSEQIKKRVRVKSGAQFNRSVLLAEASDIKQLLGNYGYANARVTPIPKINDETKLVKVHYKIVLGKVVYVRRINFFGNTVTDTKVLRRELRQLEASQFTLDDVKESKRRLAQIKWIKDIKMSMDPIEGHDDMVDINYHLEEQSSAQIMAEASFSPTSGFIYRFSLNQDNFLGTGKSTSISTSHSKSTSSFQIGYMDPYFTEGGVSQSFGVYRTKNKPGRLKQSDYIRNVAGISLGFGHPLSNYTRLSYGLNYEYSDLVGGDDPSTEIADFAKKHGTEFQQFELSTAINYSNYDNAFWPTKGIHHGFSVKYDIPLTDKSLNYYKLYWSLAWYEPVTEHFVLNASASVAYGNGFGGTKNLPFYEHYFAGGIGTVAGYDTHSLGPKDSRDRSYGGNLKTLASLNLIFPNNLGDNVRTAMFVNAGNVFDDKFDKDELRYSIGLSLTWKSIMGPLEFVIAKPINSKSSDTTRTFDFTISAGV